jgi:glycosyltransferase involved in cell wall biosynthesis
VYGRHVERHVTAVRGVSPGKTFVAGQAIDPQPFLAISRSVDRPPTALFVGRLEVEKGIQDLLEAFSEVTEPRARLRIAGTGPLDALVRARARRDSRIEHLGHVPQGQLPSELSEARLLVLPSVTTRQFKEPWGLVVNEAMAAGTPVVVTDAVGAAAGGLVRDGENGLIVPERNPQALAAAIVTILGRPQFAATLGAQARHDVGAFTHERMARAFLEAIDFAWAGGTPATQPVQ